MVVCLIRDAKLVYHTQYHYVLETFLPNGSFLYGKKPKRFFLLSIPLDKLFQTTSVPNSECLDFPTTIMPVQPAKLN